MMRRATLLTVALLAAAVVAYAGEGTAKSGGGEKMDKAAHMAKMKAELNLTDQQAQQAEKAMEELHPLHERVMAAHNDLVEAKKANAGKDVIAQKGAALAAAKKELNSAREDRFRAILTAEQFAKWKEMVAAHEKAEREGHKARPEGHPAKAHTSEKN